MTIEGPPGNASAGMEPDFLATLERALADNPSIDWPGVKRTLASDGANYRQIHDLGAIPTEKLADAIALHHGLPRVEVAAMKADAALVSGFSLRFLRAAWALPYRNGDRVGLAVADPTRSDDIAAVKMALPFEAEIAVASFEALSARFEALSVQTAETHAAHATAYDRDSEDAQDRLEDLASGAPIVTALDAICEAAIVQNATDIHIEPMEGSARVRLRVDGRLRVFGTYDVKTARGIVSRVKILSGLNIAERRLPQDGRMRMSVSGEELDVRVATAPGLHGETLVMRLLVRDAAALDLTRLGMESADLTTLREVLALPHGVVIVTGPTGSGKTTTLTAAMTSLNRPERKIMTIEDPIEYQIAGVSQTQVKPAIDLTFANALRSFLRHDPDVLMVGEMRDGETARIAVQAALTGHLVLTTLHTNTAADAITRLVDLGVEEFLLSSALRCVVGQRLVRRLCQHCRTPLSGRPEAVASHIEHGLLVEPEDARYFAPAGCAQCGQTGYRGRTAIFEVLRVDARIRQLIRDRASGDTIERMAIEGGMTTMLSDGYVKVCRGVTSFDEIVSATSRLL